MKRGQEFDEVVAWCEAHGMDHVIALELAEKASDGTFYQFWDTICRSKCIGVAILPAEIYQGFWSHMDQLVRFGDSTIDVEPPAAIQKKQKVFKFITDMGLHTFIADRILELTPVDKLETIGPYNGITTAFEWDDTAEGESDNIETLWWWIDDIIIGNTEHKTLEEIYTRWNKIHPTKQIPINEPIKEKEMKPTTQQTITKAIDILGEAAVLKLLEENMQLEQWKTMPIDTKVEIKYENGTWFPRHFAGFESEYNKPLFFLDGQTSFTTQTPPVTIDPENIRLYKE